MRSRDPELNLKWGTICTPVEMIATDGKKYNTDVNVKEATEQRDISERQIQKLCAEGRIDDVTMFSNTWVIPIDLPKPTRTAKSKAGPKSNRKNDE